MIIAVRAVIDEPCLVALVTLVHGFVHLAAGGVVVLDRKRLARHQVPDRGELAARQWPESHEDFCLRGNSGPVHLSVQRSARIRRVDVEGLEGQPVLSDVLDDVGCSYCKSCLCQIRSLPLLPDFRLLQLRGSIGFTSHQPSRAAFYSGEKPPTRILSACSILLRGRDSPLARTLETPGEHMHMVVLLDKTDNR